MPLAVAAATHCGSSRDASEEHAAAFSYLSPNHSGFLPLPQHSTSCSEAQFSVLTSSGEGASPFLP